MSKPLEVDNTGPGVPNKGPLFNAVAIGTYTVMAVAVFGRVGWRVYNKQRGMDDLMIVCAFIVMTVQTTFGLIDTHYGFGKKGKDLTTEHLHKALMYFYLQQVTYKFLGMFTKLSFLLMYIRIFQQKTFQRLAYVILVIIVLGSIAFGVATIVQCSPIEFAWNKTIKGGKCINFTIFWYTHSVFNAFFDIVIYIMPMPMIKKLQLKRSAKIGLASVFLLGAFVCVVSVIRMTFLASSGSSHDNTYGSFNAVLWTEIEGNTSILCACLPALRAPIMKLFRRLTGRPIDSTARSYALEEMPSFRQKSQRSHDPYMTYSSVIEKSGKRSSSPTSSTEIMVNTSGIGGIMKTSDVRVSTSEVNVEHPQAARIAR